MTRDIARRLAAAEAAARTVGGGGDEALAGLRGLSVDARDELRRRLAALVRRQREDPAWREPTAEESAAGAAALVGFFRERFGEETAERVAAAMAGRVG